MKRLVVTGGKGGTGKSFVATNLAVLFARKHHVVLADLDVEAPDDHVLLGIKELSNREEAKAFLPFIDTSKCTKCGVCAKVCDTGAILMPPKGFPVVFPRLCSGCTACYYACPYNAILKGYHVLGYSYVTKHPSIENLVLVTGVLREGEEHMPPVVVNVKKRAENTARDLLLIDTGAGTGNQIAISLKDSDLVIAVTEPTPLGLHDLEAILKITYEMGLRTWVVINRSGLGSIDKHVETMKKYSVEKYFHTPFHRDAVDSYVKGVPVVEYKPESIVSKSLYLIQREAENTLYGDGND